jgi:hypothetical protein
MFGLGKNNAEIDAFAIASCADLAKRFPPAREAELGGDRRKAGKTLGLALADLQQRTVAFQRERDLGVYGKARLLGAIQQELRRLAYSERFVESTTALLVPTTTAGRSD